MFTKYISHLFIICLFILGACNNEEPIKPLDIIKEYPIIDTLAGANITFAKKSLIVQEFENNWFTQSQTIVYPWVSTNVGKPNFVSHSAILKTETWINGNYKLNEINVRIPNIYIKDFNNPKNSYNYQAFLASFKKGKYPVGMSKISSRDYYSIGIVLIDDKDKTNNYFYGSSALQDGSIFEIIDVKEMGYNEILVKYKISCNLMNRENSNEGKLVGTIQLRFRYVAIW